MDNIELVITNKTKSGCVHLQVMNGNDDLGILYLSEKQYTDLVAVFRAGCFSKGIDFSILDPFVEDDEQ